MKVVFNLIKSPLILLMIGFFIIELIMFVSLCIIFYLFLRDNEEYINRTLISQSNEVFNSINFLINSRLNSLTKDLLLFNQTLNIKHEFISEDYDSNCIISYNKSESNENELNLEKLKGKDRKEKIDSLLCNDFLRKIALYVAGDNSKDFIDDKINANYLCYMVSFLKSLFTKTVISNQYMEKLNYTLYINDLILFYPWKNINDESLKNLPFFNPDKVCKYSTYNFPCSSIPLYQPDEEDLKYSSIIYMDLQLRLNNLYINSCINANMKILLIIILNQKIY